MSSSGVTDYAQAYAPWRKGIAWWVVLIQGLIALAVGIYSLLNRESAAWVIISGFCIYFMIAALRTIWQSLRGRDIGFSVLGLLAAGGGLTIGMSILVPVIRVLFFDFVATPEMKVNLFYVFGMGMLVIGLLSTGSAFVERPEHGVRWASVIRGVIFVLLGIYILYGLRSLTSVDDSLVLTVLSWGFVVIGLLLCLQSYTLYRASRPAVVPTPVTAASPAATPPPSTPPAA